MKKSILIGITIFLLIVGMYLIYAWKKGGELLFDMDQINGVSDNNPYQIRNDVYDFLIKAMDESGIPEFKEEKVRNVFLNYVKSDLVAIKNFSNKSRAIEISLNNSIIYDCIHKLGKEDYVFENPKYENLIDKETKYKNVIIFFSNNILGTFHKKSKYRKTFLNSKDLELIHSIVDSYLNGFNYPKEKNPWYHPNVCDRYFSRVLKESEFWN